MEVETQEEEPIAKENNPEKDDIVYQRRTWKMKDKTIHPDPPLPSPFLDEGLGNSNSTSTTDDLNIPIATRKGVRSCTQLPISKFVSYSRLSPSYKAFVSKLASVSVPNHV